MKISSSLSLIVSLINPVFALPVAQELSRDCGTKVFPTLYTIQEAAPTYASAVTPAFTVSQVYSTTTSTKSNRIYTIAHFPSSSFAGSYGCSLHLTIPASTTLTSYGSTALNVQTVAWPAFEAFVPTWSSVAPLIQNGVFGTVSATSGGDAFINSGICPASGSTVGLTYVFEIADYVTVSAEVFFADSSGVGPYLTFGC